MCVNRDKLMNKVLCTLQYENICAFQKFKPNYSKNRTTITILFLEYNKQYLEGTNYLRSLFCALYLGEFLTGKNFLYFE
jgi:hypothetical protein